MKTYRTIIRPSDPRVHVKLPKAIYHDLKHMAAFNARRFSEEVVARLLATMVQVEQSSAEEQWFRSFFRKGSAYKS